jgi:hypothetical protein
MNNISTVQRVADPYFHDIIREMEAIEPDAGSAGIARRNFIKLASVEAQSPMRCAMRFLPQPAIAYVSCR